MILLLSAAQFADLATALLHGARWYERNPVSVGIVAEPLAALAAKAALVALLVAVYVIADRGLLARGVVALGIVAGTIGAWSNV